MNLLNKCLVMDIETATVNDKPDKKRDSLRYVGFMLPNGEKMIFHYSQKDAIQNIISMYPIIVGHNLKDRRYKHLEMGYDVAVMRRHGYVFKTHDGKKITFVDTQEIIEKRAKTMMGLDLALGQFNLRFLAEFFKFDSKKGEFDYSLLHKQMLIGEEYALLKEYLESDLDVTYNLFKYLYDFFSGFIEFCSPKDQIEMKWLMASSGAIAYKIICYQAGLPEIYDDKAVKVSKKFEGGFVALPHMDYVQGDIYCIDFNSLYPHMFMGGNLYSQYKPQQITGGLFPAENDYWDGGTIYGNGDDAVKGKYSRVVGKIEKVIRKFYTVRVATKKKMKLHKKDSEEYKKLYKLQYAIKIFINTIYGISGSPCFKSVYNLTTASDCTAMARTSEKYAGEVLKKHGYKLLYGDTDSWYVLDVFNDINRLRAICGAISKKLMNSFNVKIDSHEFEIENDKPFKKMWFFKNDKGVFNKKNYVIQTHDDQIKVKGLKVIKGDCSELAKKVFKNHVIPHLQASGEDFYLSRGKLLRWLKDTAQSDTRLLMKRARVGSLNSYKSMSCIQAQISMRYGSGEHYLISNKYIGAGKSKKRAKLEELQRSFGQEWIKAVDMNPYMRDLAAFIPPKERKYLK